ncbi:O-antigen ligase family protein [bacterium]|nr:O-antigen ligase family protein [bacterium]
MERAAYGLFFFLLVFSPLAFGTVEQWSLTVMELLTFFALILLLLNRLSRKQPLHRVPGLLPLCLFLCYLLIQLLPMPPGTIKVISPETWRIYQETVGILDPTAWISISVNRKAGLGEFFRYGTYVCFYFLTIQLLTDKQKLQRTVYNLIIFISLLAVFAIIQNYTSVGTIYWLRPVVSGNSNIFGPYVNHNHFAGLVEMILPLALCLFLYLRPRISYKQSWREKIVELFDVYGGEQHILMGFSAILLTVSIVLSLSRGALISACLALMVMVLLLMIRGRQKGKGMLLMFFLVVILFSVSWFGWENTFERFGQLKTDEGGLYETRLDFWQDSLQIIRDFPVTGTGFGSFADIYPRYRTVIGDFSVLHAHNDYLELLIEGGLIGTVLVLWFLAVLFYRSYRVFRQRRDPFSIYLYLGCVTGMVSLLFHSVTDFNLHIGANGLYYFFLAGLLVSAAHTRLRGASAGTLLLSEPGMGMKLIPAGLTVVFLFTAFFFNLRLMEGRYQFSAIANIHLSPRMSPAKIEEIRTITERASRLDPLDGKYYFAVANLEVLQNKRSALTNYRKAIYHNPLNGEYLQRTGLILGLLKMNDASERLLQAGLRNNRHNPERYRTYAGWLFAANQKQQGMENLSRALSLESSSFSRRKIREYITTMLLNGISEAEMRAILPDKVRPLIGFADYLVEIGKDEQAEQVYLDAVTQMGKEQKINIWDFYRVFQFYLKRNQPTDALNILSQAEKYLPEDVRIRIWKARTYQKLGITYRAIEEYQLALALDSGNQNAQKELTRLVKQEHLD